MRICHFALLVSLTLSLPTTATSATPAESLLGPLLGEFTTPQLRCEWIASHAVEADRELSLHRQDIQRFEFRIGRALLATSDSGALISALLEHRADALAALTVELNTRFFRSRAVPGPGAFLEVSFVDRAAAVQPFFCGPIIAVRSDASTDRIAIAAVQPRPGPALRASRVFQDMKPSDIISQLGNAAGLPVEIEDLATRPVSARIEQRNEPNWPFMRSLARQEDMELTLSSDGTLIYRQSRFAPPPSEAIVRSFTEMTWIEMVANVAGELGLQYDVEESESFPTISARQTETNLAFAHRLAAAHQRSAYLGPGVLRVRDDGFWRSAPSSPTPGIAAPARTRPSHSSSFSALITASSAKSVYRRTSATARGSVSVFLNLPSRSSQRAKLPSLIALPQDSALITQTFRSALQRVRALGANNAREAFLADLAQVYEPSLLLAWNIDESSRNRLDRIGRTDLRKASGSLKLKADP